MMYQKINLPKQVCFMRKSFILFVLLCIGTCTSVLWAQKSVSGVVMDKDLNMPLAGANVVVKGTTNGTVTDMDGKYAIQASPADVLQFSFLGMDTKEESVGQRSVINVELTSGSQKIEEVVVTAMGIQRKAKSLSYSTDIVKGDELTRSKEANLINSLQGKTAGLIITPNSTGAGGSSKILLRGNTSIMGSNSPLIVVDGVPMPNQATAQINSTYGGQRDGGDAMSNLNPDDVESINVLKGASAAALYGSMAANGAIMITTKNGREGKVRVDVSSNTSFETPLVLPKLQNEYGARTIGSSSLLEMKTWGDKMTGKSGENNLSDFYRTGSNFNNSVALSGGSKNMQTYFSYGNTTAKGITPTNDFMRHNITLRENFKMFEDRLNINVSANYINQKVTNKPSSGKLSNPITGLYLIPRNDGLSNYEEYDILENQNWNYLEEHNQNPYWVLNRMKSIEERNRFMLSGQASLKVTDFLKLDGRLSMDRSQDTWERNISATSYKIKKGRFQSNENIYQQMYGDFMATFNKNFSGYTLNVVVGTSFSDIKNTGTSIWLGDEQEPYFTNWFVAANGKFNPAGSSMDRKRKYGLFGSAQIGFKDIANLDISARNDWSSSLYGTPDISYFYPSFGANVLLDKIIKMPETINMVKVRGSYSIVGNDIPSNITTSNVTRLVMGSGGSLQLPEDQPFTTLKPEKTHSLELGLDYVMFNNRLNFDFTWYKTNTKNQFFKVEAPWASGYRNRYINAGNVQNSGFETSVSWSQEFGSDWMWTTKLNFAYNENEIKELVDGLKDQWLSEAEGFYTKLVEGGSYGDVYVRDLLPVKDQSGKITGVQKGDQTNQKVGNLNSKIHLGWSNTISYKNVNLYFLIDGKFNGKVISITQGWLDAYGVSEASAEARNNGGVDFQGAKINAEDYYNVVGQGQFAGKDYVYDSSNLRLRELSLGYTFQNLFGQSKNLTASLVGRNLFFIFKNAPIDPDISSSTANGWQGLECFNLPTTRTFGLNLKLNF